MARRYIKKGIKNIIILLVSILLLTLPFLYKFKDKFNLSNYSWNSLNIYWLISAIIYASILIMIYSYNRQYPNSKNKLLVYFKKFDRKDFFVIFSIIFSLHFLFSLFTNFYGAMSYGSIYSLITFAYLIMAVICLIIVFFLVIKMVYRLIKKIFGNTRIKLSKDKKNIKSILRYFLIDVSYITYNIKSKAPLILRIFNIIIYSIFLILLISIIFTINSPVEIKGKVITLGELNEMNCRKYAGCHEFTGYVVGVWFENKIQTFVLPKKEFSKCDWNLTERVVIEANPIVHTIPSLNSIKECV